MRGCLLGFCVGFQLHCAVPVCEMQERGTRALRRRASAPCTPGSTVRMCSESKISSVTDTPSPFSDHLSSSHVPSIRLPFSFCFLPPPSLFFRPPPGRAARGGPGQHERAGARGSSGCNSECTSNSPDALQMGVGFVSGYRGSMECI